MDLIAIAARLRDETALVKLAHGAVAHVYNPLQYAWAPHCLYLQRYGMIGPGHARGRVLLVGMNPAAWGMVQTGVPFGDVVMVRDWLGIEAPVHPPARQHPARPVTGFDCVRREPSGKRFWGWARERFGTPEHFFARFFVLNYCPLCFLEASGRNRTPDHLPAADQKRLFSHCDCALDEAVRYLAPSHVLGIGGFAAARIAHVLAQAEVVIGRIPHPSPANARVGADWGRAAEQALRDCGVSLS